MPCSSTSVTRGRWTGGSALIRRTVTVMFREMQWLLPMRIIRCVDLSVPLDEDTTVYPGDPEPGTAPHSLLETEGFNLLEVHLGSQSGTHAVAPYHVEEQAERVDELPLSLFAGEGVVVDVTGLGERGRIGWEHLAPYESRLGPGTILLLRTGWDAYYDDKAYFSHPFLDGVACARLLELGVRTICIDAINLDETPDNEHPGEGFPVHHQIARAGGVIGENFRGLDRIEWEHPLVVCFPLRLTGADGAPCRAVALELAAP